MRILFVLGATSRIRNFEHLIILLAERGHRVRLAGRPRKGVFALPKEMNHERVSAVENPTRRIDEWAPYVETLRGARDYVRYLDPRYTRATRLVRRAYEIGPTGFVRYCERHPWVSNQWPSVARLLALTEKLIPVDPGIEAFVRDERPDLMLVTPLVTFESYQTDYVKAAHRLGIPVVFLPFSWDNLTNKGLMRIHPDRVMVWNDTQKREAVELHGASPRTVVVTGAARFDDFFARTCSTTREQFFARFGLDPGRPMVLFLGSSQLTGPNELELVRLWGESLRNASDPVLRSCGILVRPHPALKESWVSVDLSRLGNVAISLKASRNADQELFDSLFHSHAAVGLNTSAMLEAAIVGRPVYTLLIPGFDEGQLGTMHFHYLVEAHGGVATVARSLEEHHRQLGATLRQPIAASARSRQFVEGFLRPRGIDHPVSPILADEIERATGINKSRAATPLWHYPLRAALYGWMRRRDSPRAGIRDETVVARSMSLRPVKTALHELHEGTSPIFVGPWTDTVAYELLYWIPFVRWAVGAYSLPADRLIVISRGGVDSWYGDLAGRYLDVSSLFSDEEHQQWLQRGIPQSQQDPKQAVIDPFDQEILKRAASTMDLSNYQVLHPLSFFRVLRRLQADRTPELLPELLAYRRLGGASNSATPAGARGDYVAVSLAGTEWLPGTALNRELLERVVADAFADNEGMLMDYPGVGDRVCDRVLRPLTPVPTPKNYLNIQTNALMSCQSFFGGFGDLAVLAAFCGVPTFAVHSEPVSPDLQQLLDLAGLSSLSLRSVQEGTGQTLAGSLSQAPNQLERHTTA